MSDEKARVRKLVRGAQRLADAADPLGRRARELLPASTGLSQENVELALAEILETHPTDAELDALLGSAEPAPRAHVLLASNVFVAALRAIALGLAQSADVSVRASRREPEMAELLWQASDGCFTLRDALAPAPGDHLWAYGNDETLAEVTRELAPGVVVHAHGAGFGVAVVEATENFETLALELARDVVPFDQRGCLSPRVCLVLGDGASARELALAVARTLEELARSIPLGALGPDEAADVTRWRETMRFAGELLGAGPGWVSVQATAERLIVPPVGRNLAVVAAPDPFPVLEQTAKAIAAVGIAGSPALVERVATLLPGARRSALGRMQRPAFDGPVDRRPATRPRVV